MPCTSCRLCHPPIPLEQAAEVRKVPCNVRRFNDQLFTFWRCPACLSLHCLEDVDLARYYADYPMAKQELDVHMQIGYRRRLSILERHGLTSDVALLDYGCGKGLFLDFLRQRGWTRVAGYDAFHPAYSDGTALERTYDAVVSFDVIEHDDSPMDFLKVLVDRVRPSGLVAIGTPNGGRLSLDDWWNPALHPPYHRHILSERALLGLGREMGLEVQQVLTRSYFDTIIPGVNTRFMWAYIRACGGVADVAFEPPQRAAVFKSPRLLMHALFGYFYPPRDNLLVIFRKQTGAREQRTSRSVTIAVV